MLNQSPEVRNQIAQLRAKALDNTITLDDFRLAIRLMRQDRTSAQEAQSASRRSTKPAKSADDLLNELDSL